MNVLVTGHHGYIGSTLVPVLSEAGHEVTGLDSFYYRGCDLLLDGNATAGPASALALDIRDVVPRHLEGQDAVIHLAALSNDPLGEVNTRWTAEINFGGTLRLARAAKKAGVPRFVFASSCSMYGAAADDLPLTEQAPLRPLTAYAESKVRAEGELTRLADADFAPVYMRNATAYGVSPRLRLDVVLNNLVGWGFTTGKIRMLSDGTPWRPLVHVRDIAKTALQLLDAPADVVGDQAFNVGRDDENYQVRELAETVRRALPNCRIEYARDASPDPRSYRVDFGKLARTFPDLSLDWTAETGAAELVTAFRRAKLTQEDFGGDRFTRLKRLKRLIDAGELDGGLRWREGSK
jgi:nucleoside-diphosphate-sugar epimerase